MSTLRNLPIKRKLMAITMLASGIALTVACLAFVTFDQVGLRKRVVRDLSITASMTGLSSAAGLTFNEPRSVEPILQSLSVQPGIRRGCIYDKDGKPFATYQRAGLTGKFRPPPVRPEGYVFDGGRLELTQRIQFAHEEIGTVYLVMDLRDMTRRVWQYTLIAVGVLLASVLVALSLSARLQKVISQPLTELAKTVTRVATDKDYSIRATGHGADEVGRLIAGFNEMLSQIQQRDVALESARATLEQRVDERTRELASSFSLLNATLESTTDAILAADHAGKITCYNRNLIALLQPPMHLLQSQSYMDLAAFAAQLTTSPEQFDELVQTQRRDPKREYSNIVLLKDGRIIERHVRPQKIGDQCVGQVIILRDITERRQAEAKLEEVSRRAGMAQVATNVLHNVGNVLNSVNTSAAIIMKSLRDCRSPDLGAVADRLAENQRNLGAFLNEEKRAAQLVTYLQRLDQHLTVNQNNLLTEFEGLLRNIEHIKEIVAMQQSYARTAGTVEQHSIPLLVEDALRMYDDAFGRHQVRTVRRFNEVPNIAVDKHKVLQILVNLLSNAKHAMSVPQVTERVLTVDISRSAPDRVQISVTDTGIGISAENLTRIFGHGFTTRPDGHGFGLHGAALAASELGGQLLAQSDGPGHGATFILKLPVSPPVPNL